ncbi:hypothetical protein KKF84_04345, partial [Myxococcota bacterium]|nr:hypothetical protein [Myxococcota bacterium]MBU1534525.1 hypothetical protein [Myxococcota bacterium]
MVMARTLLLSVGGVMGVASGGMLFALLTALFYGEEDLFALILATLTVAILGAVLWILGKRWPDKRQAPPKAAFMVVTVGWLVMSVVGALPYYYYARLPRPLFAAAGDQGTKTGGMVLTSCSAGEKKLGQEFCSFSNCLFESVSGFTTTGASIVSRGLWSSPGARGGLPHGILMWRAMSQWLGGMGIVLLAIALFPFLGIGGYSLYRAEVPGPTKEKLTPRLTRTAAILWMVYGGLTLLQIVLLAPVTGVYQAITHAFATMATGGFSPLGLSVGGFHSAYVEWVIIIFMFLAGANFALHAYVLLKGQFRVYAQNGEFMTYLLITLGVAVIVAFAIRFGTTSPFRDSLFQIVSLMTTTGFASVDFEAWPSIGGLARMAPFWVVLVMFIGGCAGS